MTDPEEEPIELVTRQGGQTAWVLVAASAGALCASLGSNAWLWNRARRAEQRVAQTTVVLQHDPPRAPCAVCAVCHDAGVCPVCPTVLAEVHRDGGLRTTPTPPPRVDDALALQGETRLAGAADAGERDPVHLGAQRAVITGVDQIAASRSGPAAERFLQRNLPGIASMDCAFRDPALAEHVRVRLREVNLLARPRVRLSEEQLVQYERNLRCPRE